MDTMADRWDDRTRAMGEGGGYDRGYDRGRDGWDRTRVSRPSGAPRPPAVNGARLWSGGIATAVVAALVALVGLLLVRVLLQIPYLAPLDSGALGDGNTTTLCVLAAAAALAATALAHLLLLGVPSPMAYFGWIAGLVTAIAAVLPLLDTDPLGVRIATGAIHLVIGLAIISLVTTTAMAASSRA